MARKIFSLLLLFMAFITYAQPPEGITYQGVAYNQQGNPVVSSTIGVRVSILNTTATGTIIFSEVHSPATNNQGVYSFTIGSQNTQDFAQIDWGNQNKFLKVEIDPAGGTSYSQISTTQLKTVPYAFYSKSTAKADSFSVLDNINSLRNIQNLPNPGDMIYVKGYYVPGDGGGGNFVWRTDPVFQNLGTGTPGVLSDDNNGTLIKIAGRNNGMWVRQYDGYINVAYFGAIGISQNYTQPIQNAIDFAEKICVIPNNYFGSSSVFIPAGKYIIDNIVLKHRVSVIGESMEKTIIYPSNSSHPYLVSIEPGRIELNISNLAFVGAYAGSGFSGNSSKGVINLSASQSAEFGDGGVWDSTFKNISISNFKGIGIYLLGGTSNYMSPNQFSLFENIKIVHGTDLDSTNPLRIEGQNGQLTFINCEFIGGNSTTPHKGASVFIKGHRPNGKVLHPAVVTFLNCGFQYSNYGISMDYAESITIDGCSFNRTGIGINVNGNTDACSGINIVNNKFVDSAGFGNLSLGTGYIKSNGYCISSTKSSLTISGNYIVTSVGSSCTSCGFYNGAGTSTVKIAANSFQNAEDGKTIGVSKNVAATSFVLATDNDLVYLSSSDNIGHISSRINSGGVITVKAAGPLVFTNGNIKTSGGNISLAAGEIIQFKKTDYQSTIQYEVISVVKNNP